MDAAGASVDVHHTEVEVQTVGDGRAEHDPDERVIHAVPEEPVPGDEHELDSNVCENLVCSVFDAREDVVKVPFDALVMDDEFHDEPDDKADPQELRHEVRVRGVLAPPEAEPGDDVNHIVGKVVHVDLPGHSGSFVFEPLADAVPVIQVEADHDDGKSDVIPVGRLIESLKTGLDGVVLTHCFSSFIKVTL